MMLLGFFSMEDEGLTGGLEATGGFFYALAAIDGRGYYSGASRLLRNLW